MDVQKTMDHVRETLDACVELLTESHLETWGGYPYDYERDGDTLWIAALDSGKDNAATRLERHYITTILTFAFQAQKHAAEDGDEDWLSYFSEAYLNRD